MAPERLALARAESPAGLAARLRALVPGGASVEAAVREIVGEVRAGGDAAVLECTRRWDTAGGPTRPLVVEPGARECAAAELGSGLRGALELAIANAGAVAEAGLDPEARELELEQGQRIVLRDLPVASAAVYVPGGRAPYPSTVVMGVTAARAAGVGRVAVCSPPRRDGELHPVVLAAAALSGADVAYRMGGAQAIAALAHGTESVAPVDVIVGPGSLYVQEAKRQLSDRVGIDSFAGPSDLVVLASADADPALVALDLRAQAEHGAGTVVAAISPREELLDAVAERLGEAGDAALALVDVPDLDAGLAVAEAFAPEHLQLMGAEAEALAPRVRRAGCLFVGAASATAFGDYVAGSNHVLPTGGTASFASGLSARHFRRRMAEVHVGDAAAALAAAGAALARAEGFELHARSMEARVGENGGR